MEKEVPKVEGKFDTYKDWEPDKGYFLIKIYPEEQKLGIRYCDMKTHEPKLDIFGTIPQELYSTAIEKELISNLQHAAYLGKELYKAYVCLKLGKEYIQDDEIEF
jgi:dihydropteroate synthase